MNNIAKMKGGGLTKKKLKYNKKGKIVSRKMSELSKKNNNFVKIGGSTWNELNDKYKKRISKSNYNSLNNVKKKRSINNINKLLSNIRSATANSLKETKNRLTRKYINDFNNKILGIITDGPTKYATIVSVREIRPIIKFILRYIFKKTEIEMDTMVSDVLVKLRKEYKNNGNKQKSPDEILIELIDFEYIDSHKTNNNRIKMMNNKVSAVNMLRHSYSHPYVTTVLNDLYE